MEEVTEIEKKTNQNKNDRYGKCEWQNLQQ